MTAIRSVTLHCDHGRCPASFVGGSSASPSEVRRVARSHGWVSWKVRSGMPIEHYWQDRCPAHAKETQ